MAYKMSTYTHSYWPQCSWLARIVVLIIYDIYVLSIIYHIPIYLKEATSQCSVIIYMSSGVIASGSQMFVYDLRLGQLGIYFFTFYGSNMNLLLNDNHIQYYHIDASMSLMFGCHTHLFECTKLDTTCFLHSSWLIHDCRDLFSWKTYMIF